MSEFPTRRLDELMADGAVLLGRGDVISREDIEAHPGPYPIYSSSAHNNGKFGEYGKFMFDEELITWSVDGGGNFFYRNKHRYSVTNVCGYMRMKSQELHLKFVFYSLANQHRFLTFDYTTKAHPSVIKKQYWLPMISIAHQQKIATILTSIDTAIEKTSALIDKYQQIKAGLMHDLFTRGVLPNGQLRPSRSEAPELYQETEIGWIPREWELTKIGAAFDIQLGKMLNQEAKNGKSSFPYIGNKSVQWNRVDISDLDEMDFSPSEREKFSLKAEDLLVCEGGDVGRTAIWESQIENCYYQKAIHRLRPRGRFVRPRFMLRFMWYAKTNGIFENFTSQTSIAHLTQEKLGSVPMARPTWEEQSLLIARFEGIDSLLVGQFSLLEKFRQQKLGLMQDLLTGKVPVTVDEPETIDA